MEIGNEIPLPLHFSLLVYLAHSSCIGDLMVLELALHTVTRDDEDDSEILWGLLRCQSRHLEARWYSGWICANPKRIF